MAKINYLSGDGKNNEDGKNNSDKSQSLIEQHLKKQKLLKKCKDFLEGNNIKETVKNDVEEIINDSENYIIGDKGVKKIEEKDDGNTQLIDNKITTIDFSKGYYDILLKSYENTEVYENIKELKNYEDISKELKKEIREKDYNILLVQEKQKKQAEMFNTKNPTYADKKMLGMF